MSTVVAVLVLLYLARFAWASVRAWGGRRHQRATDEEVRRAGGVEKPRGQLPAAAIEALVQIEELDRLEALQRRLAAREFTVCKRLGHAMVYGRCRRTGCTYTTQRSER